MQLGGGLPLTGMLERLFSFAEIYSVRQKVSIKMLAVHEDKNSVDRATGGGDGAGYFCVWMTEDSALYQEGARGLLYTSRSTWRKRHVFKRGRDGM